MIDDKAIALVIMKSKAEREAWPIIELFSYRMKCPLRSTAEIALGSKQPGFTLPAGAPVLDHRPITTCLQASERVSRHDALTQSSQPDPFILF